MWLHLALLVLVGAVAADYEHAWKPGNEYHYLVRSRTFTALDELSEQHTGILIKALLTVQPQDAETLRAKVSKPQYAHVHKDLPQGWETQISDQMLELRDLPMSGKPFDIKMRHGVIRELIADRDVPTWEVNMLKSIVSQLQVDTQGENAIRSRNTQVPQDDQPYGMFKAMEDSVGGKCLVLYDITPLPEHILQNKPELVPLPNLKGDGQHIDIIKTKNYSRCEQRVDYHFGITGKTNWEPGSNENGRFLSKSSTSRIVISGNLKSFTIQSSVTTNKMFVSPRFYDQHTGVVVSRMNLTLASVKPAANPLRAPNNPESAGNLVYTYNNPFSESEQRRPGRPNVSPNSKASDSSSMSSTSSSEEARRNGQNRQSSSGSSSASSSSISSSEEGEFWQPKPTLDEAPQNPLLPLFVGNKGKAIGMSEEIDPVRAVKDLVSQIANELEDPSNIPTQETLEKFTILTSLIRTMSRKQIAEAESNMHLSPNELKANDKSQAKKQNAWAVFRDAVTQAGTGPALLTIKDWIENRKIEGLEAADIVARIPKNARTPTAEYVDALFKLASNPEVKKQRYLSSATVLAFAELVRKSQVSNSSIHNRYPVHAFGRLSSKHNQAVLQEYIPFLARELKEAIRDGDSPRIQTYIMALGNIAHPKILAVFEPYLEGKEHVSTFQRTMMVAALGKLASLHPKLARSVLYKIYLNTMDAHEVRCTAVYLLMKTNPPLTMLQRMAEFTFYDTSKHVNSAVKSTILSIAQLERPEYRDLANKARAALFLLNPQEYSYHYSKGFVTDSVMGNGDLAYRLIVNYIGSDDGIIPRAWYVGLDTSYGDFKAPTTEMQAMLSSVSGLLDMYLRKGKKDEQIEKSATEKIAEILNIQPEDPVQVEGHLLWDSKYAQKFFSFDNHTIERIPELVARHLMSMKNPSYVNMNQLTSFEITLGFPTESGLPFVYTLKVPSLFKISGNSKAQVNNDWTATARSEFRLVYSMKVQGRMGFVVPFEHQHFIAGVDMNFQSYVPGKLEAELNAPKKSFELKLWPVKGEQDARLMHYSIVPYTSKHDIMSLRPVLSDKNTQKVHTSEPQSKSKVLPTKSMKILRVDMEADDLENDGSLDMEDNDALGQLIFPWSQTDDKYRKVDVFMDLDQEPRDPITFRVSVDSMQASPNRDSENSEEFSPKAMSLSATEKGPENEKRRKQFLREAADGMNSGQAHVIDIRLDTPGQYRSRNALTLAWAKSNTNVKARTLVFWQFELPDSDVKYQVCAAANAKGTTTPSMDFETAIKTKPKVDLDVDVRHGETCLQNGKINIKGKLSQSNELKETILQSSVVKKCREQMKDGNKALRACQMATQAAMILDEMEITMDLHSKVMQAIVDQAVDTVKDVSPNVRVDATEPKNAGKEKIDIRMKFSQELDKADISVHTPLMDVTFPDVRITEEGAKPAALFANDNTNIDAAAEKLNEATCVLDNTEGETFDGRAYPLKLGKCWHVVMTTYPKENPDNPNESLRIPENMRVSVVSRETENGKEVKINLGEKEIRLTSSGSQLKATIDGRNVQISRDRSHQEKNNDEVIFEIIELSNGPIRLISAKYNIDAVYDGKRIQIKANSKYRNSLRGLCGNFDGESDNDFTSPKNCMLRRPEEFLASYALLKDECEGPSVENARRLEKAECKRKQNRQSNVINEWESGRAPSADRNWGYHANEQQGEKRCNTYRTQVAEVDDKICFTTRPVPACAPQCFATQTKTKNYQFHCMQKNQASLEMKKRVEKGANPDLSQKAVSLTRPIEVPLECRA